jgi:hypothetical protein
LRIDPANEVLGLRLNVWTSILVFAGAVTYIVVSARRRPGRETPAELTSRPAEAADSDASKKAEAAGDPGQDAEVSAGEPNRESPGDG